MTQTIINKPNIFVHNHIQTPLKTPKTPEQSSTPEPTKNNQTLQDSYSTKAHSLSPFPVVLGAASLLAIKPAFQFAEKNPTLSSGILATGMAVASGKVAHGLFKEGRIGEGVFMAGLSTIATIAVADTATNLKFGLTNKVLIRPLVKSMFVAHDVLKPVVQLAVRKPEVAAVLATGVSIALTWAIVTD